MLNSLLHLRQDNSSPSLTAGGNPLSSGMPPPADILRDRACRRRMGTVGAAGYARCGTRQKRADDLPTQLWIYKSKKAVDERSLSALCRALGRWWSWRKRLRGTLPAASVIKAPITRPSAQSLSRLQRPLPFLSLPPSQLVPAALYSSFLAILHSWDGEMTSCGLAKVGMTARTRVMSLPIMH